MDNIVEVLTFLIFAVIYFFVSVIGQKGEDTPRRTRRTRESGETGTGEDSPGQPNPAEEFRRIQEEIRRRIRERTHPGEERSEEPTPTADESPTPEPSREPVPIPAPAVFRRTESAEHPGEPVAPKSRDPLAELRAMRERAEQSRRDLESQHPGVASADASRRKYQTVIDYSSLRQKARAALRSPDSARAAFLYQEIFANPVGMRDSRGGTRPSWEQ